MEKGTSKSVHDELREFNTLADALGMNYYHKWCCQND